MKFAEYLMQQLRLHPAMQPQDVVKLCYQAAFGAEHLLSDPEAAGRYLLRELEQTPAGEGRLWEPISDRVCRVNLAAWKARGLPVQRLLEMFVQSARVGPEDHGTFETYLAAAQALAEQGKLGFSGDAWAAFLQRYRQAGCPPVHHSQIYRQKEKPAYRIVRRELLEDGGQE